MVINELENTGEVIFFVNQLVTKKPIVCTDKKFN